MYRILEVIFRHPLRLLTLIVVLPVVGVAIMYVFTPHTYQSTASLWALRRYEVIGATGPESDLTATPAQTQTTSLTELLQARSFALAVAHEANLAGTLHFSSDVLGNPQRLDDALFAEISKNVIVTPNGYNLYGISYINQDPQVAQAVIKIVIQNFGSQSIKFSVSEGQRILQGYQTYLASTQADVNAAVANESRYIAQHPGLTLEQLANDPQYALLLAKTQQAQSIVQTIQGNIATVKQTISTQGTSVASLYQIIDEPILPNQPVSRLKQFLYGGGIGLGVGLLAAVLYILLLVRRDQGMFTATDLEKITTLPVLMQVPYLTPTTVSLLAKESGRKGVMLGEDKSRANGHLTRR